MYKILIFIKFIDVIDINNKILFKNLTLKSNLINVDNEKQTFEDVFERHLGVTLYTILYITILYYLSKPIAL